MNKRDEYLDSVCREVRFRAARKYVRQELSAHIGDKQAELAADGVTDAEAAAINAMGDPVETGRALSAIHRPRVEWGVIACVLLLTTIIAVSSFVGPLSYSEGNTTYGIGFPVNWPMLALSLAAMAIVAFIDYTHLVRLRHVCFAAGLACVAAYALFPAFSHVYLQNMTDGYIQEVLSSIINPVAPMMFLVGTAGFLNSCHWNTRETLRLMGLIVVSVLAAYIVSSVYSLVLMAAEIIMLLAALAAGSLSPVQKRRTAAACVAAAAVPVASAWLLFPQATVSPSIFRLLLNRVDNGLPAAYAEYEKVLRPNSTDSALTAAFKEYSWLYVMGIIVIFAALLTIMLVRSFKTPHPLGRLLMLGISAYFGFRFALFVLTALGVTDGLSVGLPLGHGSFNHLTDSLLIGMFLSVWRRSSFMPRDAVPGTPATASAPAQPTR